MRLGALKDSASNYKTVFVLGVGLKKNISQTISTLMELKAKGGPNRLAQLNARGQKGSDPFDNKMIPLMPAWMMMMPHGGTEMLLA